MMNAAYAEAVQANHATTTYVVRCHVRGKCTVHIKDVTKPGVQETRH